MVKRLIFVSCLLLCLQVSGAETALVPEDLSKASAIVSDMVKDKSPDEIIGMANVIALALSKENLCGAEAIQAMVDVGIPFETVYESVINACNLSGPELAALNRSLAPGLSGQGGAGGGPGGEVSP